MKTILFLTCLLAGMLVSCSSDRDDVGRKTLATEGLAPLENAIYLKVADEEQTSWIQSLITKNPYLKVFRSGKGEGLLLVEIPLKGNEVIIFDKEGKDLSVTTNEQLLQIVQDRQPWTLTHIYSFPLKPGDAEWDFNLHTVDEIKKMLQLPATLLHDMTTSDLIETSLDYQYSTDFIYFDEKQRGVEYVRQEFNGLDELLKRNNLAEAMLKKYELKIQTAEVMNTQGSLVKGSFSLHFLLFQLLAQDEMLNQLSREQLRQLIDLSKKTTRIVDSLPDLFGTTHHEATIFLYSRIIVHEGGFVFESDEEKSKLEDFAQTCTSAPIVLSIFTVDMQQRIYNYLERLLNDENSI